MKLSKHKQTPEAYKPRLLIHEFLHIHAQYSLHMHTSRYTPMVSSTVRHTPMVSSTNVHGLIHRLWFYCALRRKTVDKLNATAPATQEHTRMREQQPADHVLLQRP